MKSSNFTLSRHDINRLKPLLLQMEYRHGDALPIHLLRLASQMDVCNKVDPPKVPADVVTMNSRVLLQDPASKAKFEYELVFPIDAEPLEGRISVLTPMGAAMLGARLYQSVDVSTSSRRQKKLVVREIVFQPEAAGRYDL